MKKYNTFTCDSEYDAIDACNKNQDWNVINFYPTGWSKEVTVVYYIIE